MASCASSSTCEVGTFRPSSQAPALLRAGAYSKQLRQLASYAPTANAARCTGFGLANLDVGITRSVFDTLANHYPERMGVLYMFDAPFVFW